MKKTAIIVAGLSALALTGCKPQVAAPLDRGICWQAIALQNGQMKFNKVSEGAATMEACAAALEGMRLRFLNMGGSNESITGAYQGNFLFLTPQGVFMSQSLNGARYFALGYEPNGDLATAAALSQQ